MSRVSFHPSSPRDSHRPRPVMRRLQFPRYLHLYCPALSLLTFRLYRQAMRHHTFLPWSRVPVQANHQVMSRRFCPRAHRVYFLRQNLRICPLLDLLRLVESLEKHVLESAMVLAATPLTATSSLLQAAINVDDRSTHQRPRRRLHLAPRR